MVKRNCRILGGGKCTKYNIKNLWETENVRALV